MSLIFRKPLRHSQSRSKLIDQQGFTLIELIVGIMVLTISLAIVSTLIAPAEEKSADNILQIKASELAQSLMSDITSRAFDHNSDMTGGLIRCGETGAPACSAILGPEDGLAGRPDAGETNRNLFDDVDDFDGFTEQVNSTDDPIDGGYSEFTISVSVIYAGSDLGLASNLAKRITVTVTTPLETAFEFTSHKANF